MNCPINVDQLKTLLLDMAQVRCFETVLKMITERLSKQPGIALARIWLTRPGDICETCPMAKDCSDRSRCLHLVASAGQSIVDGEVWNGLEGRFRRFPYGARKIGHIAATGQALEIPDLDLKPQTLAHPDWGKREKIRALGGQPLVYQGEVLGVLAVFTRSCLSEDNLTWLRMIADHAAAAITNARAFLEIGQLKTQLELERDYLREEIKQVQSFGDIVGQSLPLQQVLRQIELVAPTDASVLILGESGTGKELIAREIHRRSQRRGEAMVRVNCASIPHELYESEFFGHVKGAFTGALNDRAGRFELADGGTLFLDEVGEIPILLQSKLLRVLQEGEYERLGDNRTRKANVRIIAATNRDLKEEIAAQRFREDLYYRLNVFPIEISPLRDRKEDIPILANHFLNVTASKLNRPKPRLTQGNIVQLQRYQWPGNIRELQNVLERAVITSKNGRLQFEQLASTNKSMNEPEAPAKIDEDRVLTEDELRQLERDNIRRALVQTRWKVSGAGGAAELLGLNPATLSSRIRKFKIQRPLE